MSIIDRREDKEICHGCLCLIKAKSRKVNLNTLCHGNPSIIIPTNETILECPCTECIVKAMCFNMCMKYIYYKKLASGDISVKIYQQNY